MELQLFKNLGQNMVDPNNPTQYFQFIASKNGSNINLFADSSIPADTYYIVNGERSRSPINSLSFSAGDDVKICYGRYYYDSFSCDNQNYFTSITGAIPRLTTKSLMHVFNGCNALQTIPSNLFVNNPQLTNLYNCFQFCSSLTAIPDHLFDCVPLVTNFANAFFGCDALTHIPIDLFNVHTQATSFAGCFNACKNLTVNVQVGSLADRVSVTWFALNTLPGGTVYCRQDSGAYNAFINETDVGVSVAIY